VVVPACGGAVKRVKPFADIGVVSSNRLHKTSRVVPVRSVLDLAGHARGRVIQWAWDAGK